jgi:hypothetical protein
MVNGGTSSTAHMEDCMHVDSVGWSRCVGGGIGLKDKMTNAINLAWSRSGPIEAEFFRVSKLLLLFWPALKSVGILSSH